MKWNTIVVYSKLRVTFSVYARTYAGTYVCTVISNVQNPGMSYTSYTVKSSLQFLAYQWSEVHNTYVT